MYKLKDNSFKSAVLQQVVYLFYNHDPKFYERLDANEMLLGFENGVYDFTTLSFREGIPNDYLTFTTGYDYIENTEHEQEILEMLSQILPDKDILHYTISDPLQQRHFPLWQHNIVEDGVLFVFLLHNHH